ncbi:uncharacterized protein LOC115927563 [Strongylocentrotus purpuratus]|uniref:Death domain-containing protein n=1 Tax=Strongylocentrotus purpuratus TaxID=7668 RepID=A0A7M7T2P0_STRPU|nr:uncharacterized protein LOC115927563 [Strongylocentrotus purpuratus]
MIPNGYNKRQETLFRHSIEVNVRFVVNTSAVAKSKVYVQFILEQNTTIDIICPVNLSGDEVTPRANRAQRLTYSPEVKDVHLEKISNGLYPENFSALHVALGIQSSIAQCILKKNGNDYTQTYMKLLQMWNTESRRTFEDLDQVLVESKAGGLRSTYKQEQK